MSSKTRRLAIVSTHPIQYQSPWFRALAQQPDIDLEVFFCHQESARDQASAGFGVEFSWDLPLLEGYPHRFLRNVAREPAAGTFNGMDTPEIGRVLDQGRFDAVMVNGWHYKSAWQTLFACWKARRPVMVRGDSHLHTPRAGWKQAAKKLGYRPFISRLDACLAVGKWSSEYYLEYGAKQDRIFVVPHCVDSERFTRSAAELTPDRLRLREQWGLQPDTTVFLFAAKFIPKKRPLDFVNAVAQARAAGAAVEGLMVGDGPLRPESEARVRETGAPVRFAGFLNQTEIVQAYVAADVFVLASDGGETWGLVVNEAMTCGLPSLVSDQVGCGPDLVLPGQTGDIFPLGDVDALGRLMASYASKPGWVRELGRAAREKIQDYSLPAAVAGMQRALDRVVRE